MIQIYNMSLSVDLRSAWPILIVIVLHTSVIVLLFHLFGSAWHFWVHQIIAVKWISCLLWPTCIRSSCHKGMESTIVSWCLLFSGGHVSCHWFESRVLWIWWLMVQSSAPATAWHPWALEFNLATFTLHEIWLIKVIRIKPFLKSLLTWWIKLLVRINCSICNFITQTTYRNGLCTFAAWFLIFQCLVLPTFSYNSLIGIVQIEGLINFVGAYQSILIRIICLRSFKCINSCLSNRWHARVVKYDWSTTWLDSGTELLTMNLVIFHTHLNTLTLWLYSSSRSIHDIVLTWHNSGAWTQIVFIVYHQLLWELFIEYKLIHFLNACFIYIAKEQLQRWYLLVMI